MDWEFTLPIGFLLLGTAGLVCAGFAIWYYFRLERRETAGFPVALVLFLLQYALAYAAAFNRRIRMELLLRTSLMFFTAIALIITVRVGLQSHDRSGRRISLAAVFTLGAYLCLVARLLRRY